MVSASLSYSHPYSQGQPQPPTMPDNHRRDDQGHGYLTSHPRSSSNPRLVCATDAEVYDYPTRRTALSRAVPCHPRQRRNHPWLFR
jgi:hypothetical protein